MSWPWQTPKASLRSEKQTYLSTLVREHPAQVHLLSAFVAGSVSSIVGWKLYSRYLRRKPSSNWITPDILAKRRWIKGRVTSVGDADNFRLYHMPGFGWSWPLKFRRVPGTRKDLQLQTIHIRMAGIDAPEASHFGNPAQEFAKEALDWTVKTLEGKIVYCQLIKRDQYSRIVAVPMLPRRLVPKFLTPICGRCVSLEMLRAGWATTYTQAGAEYGKWGKDYFMLVEDKAKAAKRGQWVRGIAAIENPAEYKRKVAKLSSTAKIDMAITEAPSAIAKPKVNAKGRLRRVLSK